MTQATSAEEIFTDAHHLYEQALRMLEQGDTRDAAEKAWCATLRSTDALIIARTGQEPETSRHTSQQLAELIHSDESVRMLRGRYYTSQRRLHGDCFYSGLCEPLADTTRLITETIEYIRDAEELAGVG